MLDMINITKKYNNFQLNCTLKIPPGRVTGLIGPNGAGKSTAFKAALGLIHPDSGVCLFQGKPCAELTAADKQSLGVVFSHSGFCELLCVREIISILRLMYPDFQEEEFRRRCASFELTMHQKIKTFSSGMKAKLNILTALSHNAKLLILDEPTAGLDVIARDEVLSLLYKYMQEDPERSILISSHIASDLEGICDDIYMIHQGQIILHETMDALLDEYGILKVTEEQFAKLDQSYLLKHRKDSFGYRCLTNQRQFYQENYPDIVLEKGSVDEIILMLGRKDGKTL